MSKLKDLLLIAQSPMGRAILAELVGLDRLVELAQDAGVVDLAADFGELKAGGDRKVILARMLARLEAQGMTATWLRQHLPSAAELRELEGTVSGDLAQVISLFQNLERTLRRR